MWVAEFTPSIVACRLRARAPFVLRRGNGAPLRCDPPHGAVAALGVERDFPHALDNAVIAE